MHEIRAAMRVFRTAVHGMGVSRSYPQTVPPTVMRSMRSVG